MAGLDHPSRVDRSALGLRIGRIGHERTANLTVSGAVATPATYSLGQLQALPQTVFTVS